jgi:AcrR family transcriptional regulator
MIRSHAARPRGRPRGFNPDAALARALEVFWRQGYQGTSLHDLTAAMGINRPSLYTAFGNKESLFRKALQRYTDEHMAFVGTALDEPTARRAVEALLRGYAASVTGPDTPPGCLTVQGALASDPDTDPIRAELTNRRLAGEAALRARLERARQEGELPAGADPDELARFFNTIAQGMAVQAAGGATRGQLQQVIDLALRVWPTR